MSSDLQLRDRGRPKTRSGGLLFCEGKSFKLDDDPVPSYCKQRGLTQWTGYECTIFLFRAILSQCCFKYVPDFACILSPRLFPQSPLNRGGIMFFYFFFINLFGFSTLRDPLLLAEISRVTEAASSAFQLYISNKIDWKLSEFFSGDLASFFILLSHPRSPPPPPTVFQGPLRRTCWAYQGGSFPIR